jgi:hypothetical protein
VRELDAAARMRPFEACRLLYRLAATRKIVRFEDQPEATAAAPPDDNGEASH